MRSFLFLFLLVGVFLASSLPVTRAADDDDKKLKEKEKDKAKEKEDDSADWESLLSLNNGAPGKHHFSWPKNGKVRFKWETTPDGQVPNFRVTIAKLNERNGNYQIIATIATTQGRSKDSATLNLVEGKYQLYIATKYMKYTLSVEGKGK